jgi:putative ABC transport system permease protein
MSEPRARGRAPWTRKTAVLRENMGEAFAVVRGHRLRSGLLILGVAIGVTTILAIVAILEGLGRQLEDDFASAARPYLGIQKYDQIVVGHADEEMAQRPDIEPSEADAVRRLSTTADKVDFYIDPNHPTILRYKEQRTPFVGVAGASTEFPYIFAFDVEVGRFFTEAEEARGEALIVLGYGPRNYLFGREDPLGKRVRIEEREFTVVGAFADRRTTFGALGNNYAIVPYTTFLRDLSFESDQKYIFVAPKKGIALEDAREELISIMRRLRKLRPGQDNDFGVVTSEAYSKIAERITGAVFLALVVISSIGLLVGGIGVMNIMLVSVAERTREIGIRMAVGATRRDVLTQILIEAGTLTGIGGVIGVATGLGSAWAITRVIGFPFAVPVFWVVVAVVFSAGVGLIFGLYPANRAARLDPIVALRAE